MYNIIMLLAHLTALLLYTTLHNVSLMPSPSYAPREREGLGNRAHPACPHLGISRHQSDCSTRHMHMIVQERTECN